MNIPANFVSLHPYFKVHPGKIDTFKAGLSAFREKTAREENNLFYDFTINGDEVFCREGYAGAEALLAHLENVGELLTEALKIADLTRLEVHGQSLSSKSCGPRSPIFSRHGSFALDRERGWSCFNVR